MPRAALTLLLLQLCGLAHAVPHFIYAQARFMTHEADAGLSPFVNALTSTDGIIPYNHYDLPFCPPYKTDAYAMEEDLGMVLRGDSIHYSNYDFFFKRPVTCEVMKCQPEHLKLNEGDIKKFKDFILDGYRANMILDNLPALVANTDRGPACMAGRNPDRIAREVKGYPIGGCQGPAEGTAQEGAEEKMYLNNHLTFTVNYNKHITDAGKEVYFVNGFFVEPQSYAEEGCKGGKLWLEGTEMTARWTYSVVWNLEENVDWPTRWDNYLSSSEADTNAREHWLRLTEALLIIMCLSAVVGIVLARTLHLDFNRYNNPDNEEEMLEEVGWKLVHSEVFRPPAHPNAFACFIGTGSQLLGMTGVALFFGLLGFMSPAKRGWLLLSVILLFVLMAFVNGFVTGMMQMMFSTRQWKIVIGGASAFPVFVFTLWAIMELSLKSGASNAVPASTVFLLILLWLGVCIPMAVLGASFAYRLPPIENPLRYNTLKRKIPPQRCLFKLLPTLLLPGLIPYAGASWELQLILRAVWQGQVYYVFGFASLVFLATVITVVETVITYIYYQLVYEDYRWWWKSILVPSGIGLYYFLSCVSYYYAKLRVKTWLGAYVFFSFSLVTSLYMVIVFGTVGFIAAWLFTRKIYSSIKIE